MECQNFSENFMDLRNDRTVKNPDVEGWKSTRYTGNALFNESKSLNLSSSVPQAQHELSIGEFPWVNIRNAECSNMSFSVKNHIPVKVRIQRSSNSFNYSNASESSLNDSKEDSARKVLQVLKDLTSSRKRHISFQEELNPREISKKSKPTEHHHNLYMSKLESDIPNIVEETRPSLTLKDIVRSKKRQRPKSDVAGPPKTKRRNNEIDSSLSSSIGIVNPSLYQSNISKRVKNKIKRVEQKSVEVQTDIREDKEVDKTRDNITIVDKVPHKIVKHQIVSPEVTEPMANAILLSAVNKFSNAFPELLESKQKEIESKKDELPHVLPVISESPNIQFPVQPNLFTQPNIDLLKSTSEQPKTLNELPNFGIPPASSFNPEAAKMLNTNLSPKPISTTLELAKPTFVTSGLALSKPTFGSNVLELPKPTFGTTLPDLPKPTFGTTASELPKTTIGTSASELPKPTFGASATELPKPTFAAGASELPKPTFGTSASELPKPIFGTSATELPKPIFGTSASELPKPIFGTSTSELTKETFGSGTSQPKSTFASTNAEKSQPFKFTFGATTNETKASSLNLPSTMSTSSSSFVTTSSAISQMFSSEPKSVESKSEKEIPKSIETSKATENVTFSFGSTWASNKSQNSNTGEMKLFGMSAPSFPQTFGTTCSETGASATPIFSIAKDTPKFSAIETSKPFPTPATTKSIFTIETPKPLFGATSTSQDSKSMFNVGTEAFKLSTTVAEQPKASDPSKSIFGVPKTTPETKNIFGGGSNSGMFCTSANTMALQSKTETQLADSKSIFGQIDSKNANNNKTEKLPSLFSFGKKGAETSQKPESNTQFGQSLFSVSKPEVKDGFKFESKPFVFTGGKSTTEPSTFTSFGSTPSFGQPSSSTFQNPTSFNSQANLSFSQPQTFSQQQPQTFSQQQPQTSFNQQQTGFNQQQPTPTFGQSTSSFGISSQPQINFNQPSFGQQTPFMQPQQQQQQQPPPPGPPPSFGQQAPFTFGQSSAPSFNFTAQSQQPQPQPQAQSGLFQFGATSLPTSQAFNFSAQGATPQNPGFNFSGGFTPPAGQMFSIGSGSTAPRNRTALRRKK